MTSRDRMALILLGVIALGAVAFYLLVVRGGEAPEPAPTDIASPAPAPSPDATPDEGEEEPGEPPLGTEEEEEQPRPPRADFVAAGRDPFNPLVIAADTGGSGTTPSGPAPNGDGTPPPGDGTTPPPGDGTTPPPGNGAPPPGDGGPGTRQEPRETQVIGGHRVTLIDIFVRNGQPVAQVRVDDRTFIVTEGETFGDNFQLAAIQGGCANFLFGDQGFTLCEPGERK